MKELEKILKNIEWYIKVYKTPPFGREVEGTVELLESCRDIIHKHMNNGWIPCSEGLPEDNTDSEYYESVIVTLSDGRCTPGVYRNFDKEWLVEAEDGEKKYTFESEVIAWRPLPEPYRPKED